MISEEKKAYFRELLNQRWDELMKAASGTVNGMVGFSETFADPSDRAALESERNFTLRIRDREKMLIGKIKEALERIENGTYGICEECGEDISEGRLEARPVTTLCIECKNRKEAEEKLKGQ
jgi:DnaK suppressor protein